MCPWNEIHRWTSLMNSFLLHQQCTACLACFSWMVFEMRGKWPNSCCFVGCYCQDLFKRISSIFVYFPSSFFSMCFVSVHVVHPYSNIDKATAWKKSYFILLDRSNFYMINKQSVAVPSFARHVLTSLSVNLSTYFRDLPLRVETAANLKHMNLVLFVFTWKPMPPAACSMLCSKDSAWAGIFTRSARLSA